MRTFCIVALMSPTALPLGTTRAAPSAPAGTLIISAHDARTTRAVGDVNVLLVASDRAFHLVGTTRADGALSLEAPAGGYRIVAYRDGYRAATAVIVVVANDTTRVAIPLEAPTATTDSVYVHAHRPGEQPFSAQTPVLLEGPELRRNLGSTIASTMSTQTGVAERSMGAAPARPVLRGLDNYRVLVLEDGGTVGDISATSPDHAVTIESLHAKRIEVVRGPAALMYGATAAAGVVNVVHDYVPTEHLDAWQATATVNATSANNGRAIQGRVDGPVGPFTSMADASARGGDDIETPVGTLVNTGIETYGMSTGIGIVRERGHAGASASLYRSDYGIPGGFMGGHPNGVDIHIEREHLEGKAERRFENQRAEQADIQASYSRFYQEERETDDACGVGFGVVTYAVEPRARMRLGRAGRVTLGAHGEFRDFAQACFTFLPRTDETSLAAFAYDEWQGEHVALRAALRYDARSVQPAEREENAAGEIRDREFAGVSWSLATARALGGGWSVGATVLRSFRAPSTEELFSEGPHLAAYSYEVGNADLDPERGVSAELEIDWSETRVHTSARVFVNHFDGYIYAADTGEFEIGQGSDGYLPLYQYRGANARFEGAEGEIEWKLAERWDASANASYVRAALTEDDQPLPRIPPLSGRFEAAFTAKPWRAYAAVRAAAAQDRVGEFEDPTDGYLLFDLGAEWTTVAGSFIHAITLRIDNLADTEYYNHLSRVKSIMPEAGRNVSILYRISWL